jgi:hypothetical protein
MIQSRNREPISTSVAAGALAFALAVLPISSAGCGSEPTGKPVPNPEFTDPVGDYGYSKSNPILVGSLGGSTLVENERIYLDRLRGPHGERVKYQRAGSCCSFPTPNGLPGSGKLDAYLILYGDLAEPVTIYINMYDPGEVRAPAGLLLAD